MYVCVWITASPNRFMFSTVNSLYYIFQVMVISDVYNLEDNITEARLSFFFFLNSEKVLTSLEV